MCLGLLLVVFRFVLRSSWAGCIIIHHIFQDGRRRRTISGETITYFAHVAWGNYATVWRYECAGCAACSLLTDEKQELLQHIISSLAPCKQAFVGSNIPALISFLASKKLCLRIDIDDIFHGGSIIFRSTVTRWLIRNNIQMLLEILLVLVMLLLFINASRCLCPDWIEKRLQGFRLPPTHSRANLESRGASKLQTKMP